MTVLFIILGILFLIFLPIYYKIRIPLGGTISKTYSTDESYDLTIIKEKLVNQKKNIKKIARIKY